MRLFTALHHQEMEMGSRKDRASEPGLDIGECGDGDDALAVSTPIPVGCSVYCS